ncbi:MAG: glycine oxidase ThiO [Pseudomonadota bacterium]
MKTSDVIIAGGGVIGLMTGWTLARAGVSVTVIDAGGPAATDAAAGMLSPSFEQALHGGGGALSALSEESLRRWREIAPMLSEASGVDLDFDTGGILAVAFDDFEAAAFGADAKGGEPLDRAQVLEVEPSLSSCVRGGWFAKNDGQIDPRRVRAALARTLVNEGGALIRGKRVASVQSENGKVTGVVLGNGERHTARHVVIATGARVDGVADLPEGAVFPVKGEALAIERISGSPKRVIRTSKAYLCPKADGRIVIGATEVPDDWSLNTDERRVGNLRAGAMAVIPALEDAPEISRWAGLRPATCDGAPIIGPAPEGPDGLHYALGHYRNGVLLAPATADALAASIQKGRLSPTITAFSAARFTRLGVS